jgi:DNA repair protein RadC
MSDLFDTLELVAKPAPVAPPAPAAIADGLQERASRFGCATLADYELLELLLARAFPNALRAKAQAKIALARFGSLAAVVSAEPASLAQVVGSAAALDLKLVHETNLRALHAQVARRPVISSWTALLAYVKTAMAHEAREQFRVIFLDKKNQLIADEVMNRGTVDHAPVYPREVVRRALELDASAVILVHNHPSGDPTPSSADIDMTRQIVDAARHLRIGVHDHLVVGRDGVASFKALGLM